MSDINNLLSQSGLNEADARSQYLQNLAKKSINKKLSDIQSKIEDATGLQDVGSLLVNVPPTIETGYKSIKTLGQTGKNINNKIDDLINTKFKPIDNNNNLRSDNIDNIKNKVETPDLSEFYQAEERPSNLKDILLSKTDNVFDPSSFERSAGLNNVQAESKANLTNTSVIKNANDSRISSDINPSQILDQNISNAGVDVNNAVDSVKDNIGKSAKSIFGDLTEGLDIGAVSEDFLNPVLDIGAIGTGIGTLISGMVKKHKELKEEQSEESKLGDISNIQAPPSQLTAGSVNQSSDIIGRSANTSF